MANAFTASVTPEIAEVSLPRVVVATDTIRGVHVGVLLLAELQVGYDIISGNLAS